jgi:hypothetical protein
MKRVLSLVCVVLMSLVLASAEVSLASQANPAPPTGAAYSVAEQKEVNGDLPPSCPINWKSSVLYPVLSHAHHYDVGDGAPGPLQVFYPIIGRASDKPAMLTDCGPYPLVIFLQGHCDGDKEVYRRWTHLPAALARSGYVVVVPKLPGILQGTQPGNSQDLDHAKAVLNWMHSGWEYRDGLASSPSPAVVGHWLRRSGRQPT